MFLCPVVRQDRDKDMLLWVFWVLLGFYGLGEVVSKCLGVLGYLVWRSSRKKAVYCE